MCRSRSEQGGLATVDARSTEYLEYDKDASRTAIKVFRHKFMHTAEPRVLGKHSYNRTGKVHWRICYEEKTKDHWRLKEARDQTSGEKLDAFTLDLETLPGDLRIGVLGDGGYICQLIQTIDLQRSYLEFENELSSY